VNVVRPTAYLVAAVLLLTLAPRTAAAQTFRVQIHSTPQGAEFAGRAIGTPQQRPTVITVDLDAYVEGLLEGEAGTLRNRAAR
jgi:hypothetical protein